MPDDIKFSVEQLSRRPWPYIRLIKGYRCLDCCALIEFEERAIYFATGFCDCCKSLHPNPRWPRMPSQLQIVKAEFVSANVPRS